MSRPELVKKRKPKARSTAVILGAMEERISCISAHSAAETIAVHVERVIELLDELRRSLSGQKEEEAE